ncbi:MAG: stage V sporulation protein D [Bacilli bacterium]|nr:stage V sporulation protein D [Bacilli bacterium]
MFFKNIHIRIKIILTIILLIFTVIILRVFYIEVIDYKKLNKYASNLWSRNLPIKADRGLIYDRNGTILADNVTTTSLVVIPNQIKDKEETAKKLSQILNVNYEDMLKHINKKTSIERVHPEGRRLSYEIADQIKKLKIDGVYLVKESQRNYPFDTYMSHTLGFVGIDNQGLSGIELTYNDYLTGEDGAIKYFSDAKGNKLKLNEVYEQPQDGMNITLTINNEIQTSLERELSNAVTKYNPDRAIGLVMDPNTGEILAISARPNFSPKDYKNYSIEEINRNLPVWATYEPGSTFKIITLSAALQEGKVDLDKDTYVDTGSIQVENATLHCWKHGGHGKETFLEVVENSCNPGFVVLGQRLGKNTLFDYIEKFGFGKKTGVDLNGEATGILFERSKVGPVELATTAFGQGVSVTPIQQVTAVSAAINGGTLYKPYIVKSVNEPETNTVVKQNTPTKVREVISKETSEKVRYALESVVSNGSGRTSYIDGYRVGGKTGTAQKVENGRYMSNNYILSFIGFLPADSPRVVVYIAIDNPKGTVQYGGTTVGPLSKAVLKDCIKALNIPKSDGGKPKKYQWPNKKTIAVNDVTGKTVEEAKKELEGFNVIVKGNGPTVLHQSPEPKTVLDEGKTVRIFTS